MTRQTIVNKISDLLTSARQHGITIAVQENRNLPPVVELTKAAAIHVTGKGWSETMVPAKTDAEMLIQGANALAATGFTMKEIAGGLRNEAKPYQPKVIHEYDGEQHRIVVINYDGTAKCSPWTFCHDTARLDDYRARRHGTKWHEKDLLYKTTLHAQAGVNSP